MQKVLGSLICLCGGTCCPKGVIALVALFSGGCTQTLDLATVQGLVTAAGTITTTVLATLAALGILG